MVLAVAGAGLLLAMVAAFSPWHPRPGRAAPAGLVGLHSPGGASADGRADRRLVGPAGAGGGGGSGRPSEPSNPGGSTVGRTSGSPVGCRQRDGAVTGRVPTVVRWPSPVGCRQRAGLLLGGQQVGQGGPVDHQRRWRRPPPARRRAGRWPPRGSRHPGRQPAYGGERSTDGAEHVPDADPRPGGPARSRPRCPGDCAAARPGAGRAGCPGGSSAGWPGLGQAAALTNSPPGSGARPRVGRPVAAVDGGGDGEHGPERVVAARGDVHVTDQPGPVRPSGAGSPGRQPRTQRRPPGRRPGSRSSWRAARARRTTPASR